MTDTAIQLPMVTPTRLIYRSPSGHTELAVQGGGHLDLRVLRGKDDLSLSEGRRLAAAIQAVTGEATVTIPEATRAALIALGWTPPGDPSQPDDKRPESYCHRCGGPNIIWSAPSPLWNQVMRGGDINATAEIHDGIVCPVCFATLAESAGIAELWRLHAERVHVPLATVTPSGRVWDERAWMWTEPQPEPRAATDMEVRDALHGAPLLDGVVYPELTTAEAASVTAGQASRDADTVLDAIDAAIDGRANPATGQR